MTSGNGNLMVAFTPPASNGGAPVLGYQYSLDGGDNWADFAVDVAGTPTTQSWSGSGDVNPRRYTVGGMQFRFVAAAGGGSMSVAVRWAGEFVHVRTAAA